MKGFFFQASEKRTLLNRNWKGDYVIHDNASSDKEGSASQPEMNASQDSCRSVPKVKYFIIKYSFSSHVY